MHGPACNRCPVCRLGKIRKSDIERKIPVDSGAFMSTISTSIEPHENQLTRP